MADNWVSPTGHNDPDGKWTSKTDAYDDDTGTSAYNAAGNYNYYLELTHSAINCDKIRIYAADRIVDYSDPDIDIDVYYSDGWHNIWNTGDGTITRHTWVTIEIGSTQLVTKARVKSNTSDKALYLYEFDFNALLTVETDACSNPTPSSFQGNGDTVQDGGLTVTRRGFHYSKVFDGFEWGSDTDPLDDSGGAITWTITAAGSSKVEISTASPYSGTRHARMYRDGSNTPTCEFAQSPIGADQSISLRVKKSETADWRIYHGNGTYRVVVQIEDDEKVYYYDGAYHDTGATVTVGQWHHLEIKNVDWVGHTYDIYLDEVLIQVDTPMNESAFHENVVLFVNNAGTSSCYLDEVAVWDVEDESGSYGEGEYSLEIAGLDPVTTYYVQALAENADGIAYGAVVTCATGTALEKGLSDMVTIGDDLTKDVSLGKSDSITISDAPSKTVGLFKADTMAISDTMAKSVGLVKTNTVAITDSIVKAVGLNKTDTVTIADNIAKAIGLNKVDIVNIIDSFARAVTYVRSLADTVTITDSISKRMSIVKADTVSIADRLAGKLRIKTYAKQAIDQMEAKRQDIAKFSVDGMDTARMQIKGLDIARMRIKGRDIARMSIKRMGIDKMPLFRWIIRRWTA